MRYLVLVLTLCALCLRSIAEDKLPLNGKATFVVSAPSCNERDTLELRVWDTYVGESVMAPNPHSFFKSNNVGGSFYFEVDGIKDIAWVSLSLSYQKSRERSLFGILKLYIVEPGDSIKIDLAPRKGEYFLGHYDDGTPVVKKNWDVSFSGKGNAKYKARWDTDELRVLDQNLNKYPETSWVLQKILNSKAHWKKRLAIVQQYKSQISSEVWELMSVDMEGQYRRQSLEAIRSVFRTVKYDKVQHQPIVDMVKGEFRFDEKNKSTGELIQIGRSGDYLWSLFTYVELINHIEGRGNSFNAYCETTQSIFSNPTIRDRVLTQIVLFHHKRSVEKTNLEEVFASLKDTACINMVAPFLNTLHGATAFEFHLPDQYRKWHKMSDYKDKVVLIDFWFGACVPCRVFMQEVLSPLAERYRNNKNVQVITISIDTEEQFKRAIENSDYLPKYATHLFTESQRAKHPIIEYYGVSGYPFPLLIDKKGKIALSGKSLKTIEGVDKAIQDLL